MPGVTVDMNIPSYTITDPDHQKACQLHYSVSITAGDDSKYETWLDITPESKSGKLWDSDTATT
jgi:hypothetical protein